MNMYMMLGKRNEFFLESGDSGIHGLTGIFRGSFERLQRSYVNFAARNYGMS